jgi:hypothetical protein
MSNTNFQCYYDENTESYDIPDFEFEQLLEQNRVMREMLEKQKVIIENQEVIIENEKQNGIIGIEKQKVINEKQKGIIEIEKGVNEMLNDAIEEQAEQEQELLKALVELQAENEKLKAGTLLKFQEVEIQDLQEKVEELETSLQSTENYWKSNYENERTERRILSKYSEIFDDIDGDELTDLLRDKGWEYNDEGELEKVTD